ncbi:hypothetical protein E4U19_006021 [Claviceps sp. Clav32 group G5]|nr:hypothetical protein E4U19_006021 [Claviceps sp. Clav32 group G5]KAG6048174.1 hypothetical protein E4U39_007656 [Claviceps sp. Clav50 group G5]
MSVQSVALLGSTAQKKQWKQQIFKWPAWPTLGANDRMNFLLVKERESDPPTSPLVGMALNIQDDESAEMQGLDLGDSRPWAMTTEKRASKHHADMAPLSVWPEPQGRNKSKPIFHAEKVPFKKPGPLAPPAGKAIIPTPAAQQPRKIPKRQPESKLNNGHPSMLENSTPDLILGNATELIHTANTGTLPARPKTLLSEQVVYKEKCEWLDLESKGLSQFVTCTLRIRHSVKAFLVFSASKKEDWAHNVLDVSAPDILDNSCRLFTREMASMKPFLLQFSNASGAKEFGLYLGTLQKAAVAVLVAPAKSGYYSANSEGPSILELPLFITEGMSKPNATKSEDVTKLDKATKLQITSEGAVTKSADEESSLTAFEQEKQVQAIEGVAESLFDLIEKMIPLAAAAGLSIAEDAILNMRETAIESWLARGSLGSETSEIKPELLELLCILVRIKCKAESRKHSAHPEPPVLLPPLKMESIRSDTKRIQYSIPEIQALSSRGIATSEWLGTSIVTPRRTQAVGHCSPTVPVEVVSKHNAWIHGDSALQWPDATVARRPISGEELTTKAPNQEGIPPPRSSSCIDGLGTSR